MSAAATWSTKATPMASVAGAAVLTLGIFCIVHAAVTLALGGAAWNAPAYACLLLAACLVARRLHREHRRGACTLYWDAAEGALRITAVAGRLELTHAWHGVGWVTLELRPQVPSGRAVRLVVWKSAIPAPLWSELALRIQAGPAGSSHQNKENP